VAESSEEKEPEAPEAVVWLHWLGHHLFREGAVIRKAPLATIVMAVAMFFAARWLVQMEDTGTINNLRGVIETKDAEIEFLDGRLQAKGTSASGRAPEGVAKLTYISIQRNSVNLSGHYTWALTLQNTGTGVAIGPVHEGGAVIADKPLTIEELDARFAELYKKFEAEKETIKTNNEYQPGIGVGLPFESDIPAARIDLEVVKGKKWLYNYAIIAYRDGDTPPHKWRITEFCGFTTQGGSEVNCDNHNRVHLEN
jgi:hypothetical protein